jgi:hypothetical protein
VEHKTFDPDADRPLTWDWTRFLNDGETITSSTVTVTGGTATVHDVTDTATTVTGWVTDAAKGTVIVTCHIVTSDARDDDRSFNLTVKDR